MSFDRVGPDDLTILATDKGQVPMNIGAVLEVDAEPRPLEIRNEVARRLAAIPRFRQRLLRTRWIEGPPVWVDAAGFSLAGHVGADRVTDRDAMLDRAAQLVCLRLPDDRPLWRLHVVEWEDRSALVLVMHHVLADGMGGLAVLASLVLDSPAPSTPPAQGPTRRALIVDAARSRVRGLRSVGERLREFAAGVREMGLGRQRPARVPPSSILRPTSGARRVRTITVPLAAVRERARGAGATVNDVVVGAVAGCLFDLLAQRGEQPQRIVVSVPVSARQEGSQLGNRVGAIPVAVPRDLDPVARLAHISARTRQAKSAPRGSSSVVLGWLFRGLSALGLGQRFVDSQRLVHTFETNLRGPSEPVVLAGARVRQIVPIAVNPGNVGISFDVLSYAGDLTIAIVADPVTVPELDVAAELLRQHLGTGA